MTLDPHAALVLLSGGQDSATCLAWALSRFRTVETVGFVYGQRHAVELEARLVVREGIAAMGLGEGRLGPDHLLSLPAFNEIGETAMTADVEISTDVRGLPTTFVPGRNLAFLVFAGALAARRGMGVLVGGMCGTDAAGYPDCRTDTLQAQATALALGIHEDLAVEAPLVAATKADTWRLAEKLGGERLVEFLLEETHTCYTGDRSARHPWGYGCGACPACVEREKGYAQYRARASAGR